MGHQSLIDQNWRLGAVSAETLFLTHLVRPELKVHPVMPDRPTSDPSLSRASVCPRQGRQAASHGAVSRRALFRPSRACPGPSLAAWRNGLCSRFRSRRSRTSRCCSSATCSSAGNAAPRPSSAADAPTGLPSSSPRRPGSPSSESVSAASRPRPNGVLSHGGALAAPPVVLQRSRPTL